MEHECDKLGMGEDGGTRKRERERERERREKEAFKR